MMAELTYQARRADRDRQSSNADERRRQALAKKAVMEQLNKERMAALSADARHTTNSFALQGLPKAMNG